MSRNMKQNDAISRSALLKEMDKLIDLAYREEDDELHHTLVTVCSYIQDAPALDIVPVVHGEWLLRHEGYGHYWECSACRTNPCIYVTKETNYCPSCGAKMDGDMKVEE